MEGIQPFAANLLSYIPTKYYSNLSTSDSVIARTKRVNFFETVYKTWCCETQLMDERRKFFEISKRTL